MHNKRRGMGELDDQWKSSPLAALTQKVRNLSIQNAQMRAANQARQSSMMESPVQSVQKQFDQLPGWLAPGNIGDINKVIWPFWFTFQAPIMTANSQGTGSIAVTQEAGFVAVTMTKAIFADVGGGAYQYQDPEAGAYAPGLSFTLRDAISTRQFMTQPVAASHLGNPRFPFSFPTPMFFLPNGVVEVQWFNNSATTYVPFLSLFGYRIRIEDAANMMSTVSG